MKDCVSASCFIEPWLIWLSYLTASLINGAIQKNVKWLLSHKILIRLSQQQTYHFCVEISSEAQKGHVEVRIPLSFLAFFLVSWFSHFVTWTVWQQNNLIFSVITINLGYNQKLSWKYCNYFHPPYIKMSIWSKNVVAFPTKSQPSWSPQAFIFV